jgi:GH15 family glucan-1,4-alpha-glucosidase
VTDYGLDLAVIGNGRTAALVDPAARIVWWCFPRFDGDPVFCRLLAGAEEKGFTDVVLEDFVETSSAYLRNTAIVATTMRDRHGSAIKVTDFAPRFYHLGRTHRPPQLIRMIEPVAGLPRISIRIRPTHDHGGTSMQRAIGSNHIRYTGGEVALRVTTDAPLSYIDREAAFVLTRPLHLVFSSDTPFEGSLDTTCREFCDRTATYWR